MKLNRFFACTHILGILFFFTNVQGSEKTLHSELNDESSWYLLENNRLRRNYTDGYLHYSICFQNFKQDNVDIQNHLDLIDEKDQRGLTPLFYAVAYYADKIARQLLDAGAQVNATDNEKLTPLHYTIIKNFVPLTQLLLAHNADVNASDKDGNTPLHYAMQCSPLSAMRTYNDKVRQKNLQLLVDHGVNLQPKNVMGQTPYDVTTKATKKFLINYALERAKTTRTTIVEATKSSPSTLYVMPQDLVDIIMNYACDSTEKKIQNLLNDDQLLSTASNNAIIPVQTKSRCIIS